MSFFRYHICSRGRRNLTIDLIDYWPDWLCCVGISVCDVSHVTLSVGELHISSSEPLRASHLGPQEAVAFLFVALLHTAVSSFAANFQIMKFRVFLLVSVLFLSATADLQGKKQTVLFSVPHYTVQARTEDVAPFNREKGCSKSKVVKEMILHAQCRITAIVNLILIWFDLTSVLVVVRFYLLPTASVCPRVTDYIMTGTVSVAWLAVWGSPSHCAINLIA